MRLGVSTVLIGTAMFAVGLVLFYTVEPGQTDPLLRFAKNSGTFVGLLGIGVILAGILLGLISKGRAPGGTGAA